MIGLPLHPDPDYLERVMPLLEREVGVLELAPETTWALVHGELASNAYHARFLALGERLGLPFIAHGVGLSVGSVGDPQRRARWLARIAADHARFGFRWYTDHLGATVLDGLEMTLPLGLPMTAELAAVVRSNLAALQQIVPQVGVENSAIYFLLGAPLAEPEFLNAIVGDSHHLLLDLHNLHTMAENCGFDPEAYLARLDLSRVIEIHLAGGRDSEPAWLRSRRTLRLDSHDDSVPEPVWQLLALVLPRCPGLRAVIVERMEGTVGPGDVAALAEELRRARRLVALLHRPAEVRSTPASAGPKIDVTARRAHERALATVLRAADPVAALAASHELRGLADTVDPDGLRLAALLIARLRFERLQHGDNGASHRFDADAPGFAAEFRRYHAEVAPTAAFPQDEGALYRRWRA